MKEAGTEGEGFLSGRCPMGKQRSKESQKDNKMAILCNLQAKEGPNFGYRKRMHQYWKGDGVFELQRQHLAYQIRSILKTSKLSKVAIERQRERGRERERERD